MKSASSRYGHLILLFWNAYILLVIRILVHCFVKSEAALVQRILQELEVPMKQELVKVDMSVEVHHNHKEPDLLS